MVCSRPVRACSATHEPDGRTADALCRTSEIVRRSGPAPKRLGPLPLAVRQHHAVLSPERLPPTDPSDDTRTLEPGTFPTAATATPAWPPWRSFRHVVRAHAVRARSTKLAAFRGESWATCRLSTSAIEMIREHTRGSTKLRCLCGGMPPLVGRYHP